MKVISQSGTGFHFSVSLFTHNQCHFEISRSLTRKVNKPPAGFFQIRVKTLLSYQQARFSYDDNALETWYYPIRRKLVPQKYLEFPLLISLKPFSWISNCNLTTDGYFNRLTQIPNTRLIFWQQKTSPVVSDIGNDNSNIVNIIKLNAQMLQTFTAFALRKFLMDYCDLSNYRHY